MYSWHSIQDDIKIIKYIEFKGNRYNDGDYVEFKYEDNTSMRGFLNINSDYITIVEKPIHIHQHSINYPKWGVKINNIINLAEN